jgi:NTP pyrophosphatase (non-canonical NTP hydrolase)
LSYEDNVIKQQDIITLNYLTDIIYKYNVKKGWWDNPREFGTSIALIHSELSEALEGDRKETMDNHLPHRKTVEVELADAFIRLFDLCGRLNLDIGGAIAEKFEYNKHRADHKKENRETQGGKKY